MQELLRSQRAFFYLYTSTRSALRFRFMRFSIACSFGVLYRSASVGKMFKNKLTIATGKAIESAHIFGINSIGRKPIG